jgi:hypothetical protein
MRGCVNHQTNKVMRRFQFTLRRFLVAVLWLGLGLAQVLNLHIMLRTFEILGLFLPCACFGAGIGCLLGRGLIGAVIGVLLGAVGLGLYVLLVLGSP